MQKNKVVFEIVKNDRNYQLQCDNTAPLGELYDVLNEMQAYLVEIIKQNSIKEEKPKSECV